MPLDFVYPSTKLSKMYSRKIKNTHAHSYTLRVFHRKIVREETLLDRVSELYDSVLITFYPYLSLDTETECQTQQLQTLKDCYSK